MKNFTTSVIILTKNRFQLLKKSLSSLLKQTLKPSIIMIINHNSIDKTKKIYKKHIVIIIMFFLLYSQLDILYLKKDVLPPPWDQASHLRRSLTFYRLIKNGEFNKLINVTKYYPPFFFLSTVPLYLIGSSADIATTINLLYFAILLFSVYKIGNFLFNEKVGFFSAIIISFYPFLIFLRRNYFIEFALVSFISLTIYLLLKTNLFRNLRFSILFGGVFSLAVLIKWTAVCFLVGPLLGVLYKLITQKQLLKKSLKNMLITFLFVSVITSIWYLPNFKYLYPQVVQSSKTGTGIAQQNISMPNPDIFTFESLSYYLIKLKDQMDIPLFLLFLVGIFTLFRHQKNPHLKYLSIVVLAPPYLLFSFIYNKDPRFTVPLLIFTSIISAYFIQKIKNQAIQILLLVTISFFYLAQIFSATFNYPIFRLSDHLRPPDENNWKIEEALYFINSHSDKESEELKVMILPDLPYVNGPTYKYFVFLNNLPIKITNAAYVPLNEFSNGLLSSDYVVYKNKPPFSDITYKKIVQKEYQVFKNLKDNFRLIQRFNLPDNADLLIFQNKKT